jgi:hypothetical protein
MSGETNPEGRSAGQPEPRRAVAPAAVLAYRCLHHSHPAPLQAGQTFTALLALSAFLLAIDFFFLPFLTR